MKKLFTLLFFVCLYHVGFAQWVNLDSLNINGVPAPRAGAASFTIGDTGYVVAGGGAGGYWAQSWKYNKASDTWTELADWPSNNGNSPIGFGIGDTGYVGNGAYINYNFSKSFWKYDTRLNTWTPIADMPGPGRCADVSFVINDKGYVGGGLNGTNNNPNFDFWAYDPSTGQWDSVANCPAKGVGVNAVAFAINGKGYVGTGGQFPSGSQTWRTVADFWAYDPSNGRLGTWSEVASIPCGGQRMGAVGFAINNKGYVGLGALDSAQNNFRKDFWQFDPTSGTLGTWSRIEDYAGGGREKPTSFVVGNEGYVCTGFYNNSQNNTGSGMWSYTPDGIVIGGGGGTLDIEPKSSSVCQGNLVALTVVGDSGMGTNLVWSPSTGLNNPSGDTVLATITGDIVYTVTSGNGCVTSSASDTITVKPGNAFTFTPPTPSVCPGQNVTITASEGSNFTWKPSVGSQSTGDSVVASLPSAVNSVVYAVSGLDTSGCAVTDTVTLSSGGSAIGGHVTAVRDTICFGTAGNLTLSGSSSGTIQWQSSTDDINFTDVGDTSTGYKTSPLQQTTFYRTTIGSGNCLAISDDTLELYVPPALTASFYSVPGTVNELVFNSDSSVGSIRSYHWDFGDGTISTDSNPSHTYANVDSTYYVCLTLYDGSNCSYTFCRYSTVTVTNGAGVPTVSAAGNWVIYPNPFSEQLIISAKQTNKYIQSIEMYDVLGQLVINKDLANTTNTSLQLDVSSLAKGMYYVMIRTADADYVQKVVKQ